MEQYYLAVDIGASSGRHVLGHVKDGKILTEEVYRFDNGMSMKNGHLCWDAEGLFREIKEGMRRCREAGKIPVSMGIDTWAVDFVLLDQEDRIIGDAVGYRDGRTEGMDQLVAERITPEELYGRTGIQKQSFNTIYQLQAIKKERPEDLEQARSLLMIPDYFHFLLTGRKLQEYTNATTTQLAEPNGGAWDRELIQRLDYPDRLFQELSMPGTFVGNLREEVQREVGFDCQVVLPATHDTASAVLAVPSKEEHILYISSGTWSLMGTELPEAICTEEGRRANFTNEGGYGRRFRFLKNIMGLWMIQSARKELAPGLSFGEICEMASKETISSLVDCNDQCFLAPESMTEAVQEFCRRTGQAVPQGIGQVGAVIYNSLAACYGETAREIEELTGIHFSSIHIVGGGANAEYLNRLTARETGKTVYAGPSEATAIGNLAAQMLRAGEFQDVPQVRQAIFQSFEIKTYGQEEHYDTKEL